MINIISCSISSNRAAAVNSGNNVIITRLIEWLASLSLQPILRDAFEKNPSMSLDEARQVVISCLRVLFYRDARSLNKVCFCYPLATHWLH